MPPRKRKIILNEDEESSAPPSSSTLSSSSHSLTPKQPPNPLRKRRKKMDPSDEEDANAKKKEKMDREDKPNGGGTTRFKPQAIIKEGKTSPVDLEGKKGKEVRRRMKEAKKSTTIYANADGTQRIVPFFGGGFVFSNFHPCKFQIGQREFCCSEQFYHFCKAIAFGNEKRAEELMETEKPREMKRIGRRIEGFDEIKWRKISILAMVIGLMHKFQENPPLLEELLATDGAELIEASPFDGRWGAKMGTKRILDGDRWRGKNLLGRILMAIRAHLLSPDVNFRVVNLQLGPYEQSPIPKSPVNEFATNVEMQLAEALVREFDI